MNLHPRLLKLHALRACTLDTWYNVYMSTESLHIIHVDMDAFYAAIEQRDRPGLRGKPVIVGGRPDSRSVVSTASYEARKFGIHSAMPTPTAHRLCPHGIFLPVRIKEYAAVGRQIRDIFHAFTPLVEPLSLDEAFLDVTGCEGLFGSTIEIAKQIKQRIWDETHLVASVGVAHCKFLAKLASDLDKPDGFVIIPTDKIRETLDPLPVSRLPGVGAKGEKRLHQLGIRTVKQLADMPLSSLEISLGKSGRYLWNLAHGIDDREVIPDEGHRRSRVTAHLAPVSGRAVERTSAPTSDASAHFRSEDSHVGVSHAHPVGDVERCHKCDGGDLATGESAV